MKIAVDFDGTVVDHRFPEVGPDVPHAVDSLREAVRRGHQIILYTMRSGEYLDEAVAWYEGHGIPLHGVQRDPDQDSWTTSPKCYAHIYIDDAALGVPLIQFAAHQRPCVDWLKIQELWSELGDF